MRFIIFLAIGILHASVAIGQMRTMPVGTDEGLFHYRSERGELGYGDVVQLRSGARRQGKAMEWADETLLYDAAGNVKVFETTDVLEIEYRRRVRHVELPKLPDLTVAYVERLPRDASWQGHVVLEGGAPKSDLTIDPASMQIAEGTKAMFRIHILNAGGATSEPVSWELLVDGVQVGGGSVNALEAGWEQAVEATWNWKTGTHKLRVEIDSESKQKEVVRWNNVFEEQTDAQSVAIVVARDRYESFRAHPNMADSFCFEDWAQYQLQCMNGLFKASVYPTSLDGVRERVRCDRIVVVDDPEEPLARTAWQLSLRRGTKQDGPAEAGSVLVYGKLQGAELSLYGNLRVDWDALKRLGKELGLVDLRATDTRPDQCFVTDQFERYAIRHHLFPCPQTLMHTPGGVCLDELSAAYLNAACGKPRGFRGEFLFRLPEKIGVVVRSNSGKPIEGVQVDAFQLQSEGEHVGELAGMGRDPLYSATSNAEGRLELPNMDAPVVQSPNGYALRPNPFGKIAPDGSNGLVMLRLRHTLESTTREEFHFIRLYDCCLAALRSPGKAHEIALETRFPNTDAPPSPPYALVVMEDRSTPTAGIKLRWRTVLSLLQVEEFRVYRKRGLGGESETPWQVSTCLRKNGKRWDLEAAEAGLMTAWVPGEYTPDTFFAITTVDKQGRESGLSNTAYMAWDKQCERFAIDTEAAYMTLTGSGPVQMLRWDAVAGTQPFAVKTNAFRGYKPGFSGIAISPEHRVVVSDAVNHVIATYDLNGNLEDVYPRRSYWPGFPSDDPGEFYDPVDVAIDKAGRIFVADRGNDRVQILDAQGRPLGTVDPEFKFVAPHAVSFSNDSLCVTDKAGTRVRIYRQDGGTLHFDRELPPLERVDRAIVSKTGKIYCTGHDPVSREQGVLVLTPEGDSARIEASLFEGEMGKVYEARSAYLYDYLADNYIYVVNKFPFDVRRFKMD
ncbi:MAG: CARDB domain-containing protein [Planctomycetota bacterium]